MPASFVGRGRSNQSRASQASRDRSTITGVDYANGAVCSDYRNNVMPTGFIFGVGVWQNAAIGSGPVLPAGEVGLLLPSAVVHLLEPVAMATIARCSQMCG